MENKNAENYTLEEIEANAENFSAQEWCEIVQQSFFNDFYAVKYAAYLTAAHWQSLAKKEDLDFDKKFVEENFLILLMTSPCPAKIWEAIKKAKKINDADFAKARKWNIERKHKLTEQMLEFMQNGKNRIL